MDKNVIIDKEFADAFSTHWIESWNTHDLTAMLSHYTDNFEMHSPIIAAERMGVEAGFLKGIISWCAS